jgi:hypothetical protein
VEEKESGGYASELVERCVLQEGVEGKGLRLHSDHGAPMTSSTLKRWAPSSRRKQPSSRHCTSTTREEAAEIIIGHSFEQGQFLDQAARVAQQLGAEESAEALEGAWRKNRA